MSQQQFPEHHEIHIQSNTANELNSSRNLNKGEQLNQIRLEIPQDKNKYEKLQYLVIFFFIVLLILVIALFFISIGNKNDIQKLEDKLNDVTTKTQGNNIQSNEDNDIQKIKGDIYTDGKNNIQTNKKNILTIKGDIYTDGENNIQTNKIQILKNKGGIQINSENIKKNENQILKNKGDIQTNSENIKKNENQILKNKVGITTNSENIKTNENDILSNKNNIYTNKEDINKIKDAFTLINKKLLIPNKIMPIVTISDYINLKNNQDDLEYNILLQNQKNDNNINFDDLTLQQTLYPYGNDEVFFAGMLQWYSKCNDINKCELRYFFKKYKTDNEYKYATVKNMYLTRDGTKFQLHWEIENSYIGNEDKFDSDLTYEYCKYIVNYHNNDFWSTEKLDYDSTSSNCSAAYGSPGFYSGCMRSNPFGRFDDPKGWGIAFRINNNNYQNLELMIITVRNYD